MMWILFWGPLIAACWVGTLAGVMLGPSASIVPSIGLCGVLVCARHGPARRYRITALLCGPVMGWPLAGRFLVPLMILLVLGAVAHGTRRWVPSRRIRALVALGVFFALLERLLLLLFPGSMPALRLDLGDGLWAVGGWLLTGACFAGLEILVRRSGSLRHALERP